MDTNPHKNPPMAIIIPENVFSPPNSVLMDCRGGEEEISIKEARGEQRNTLIIKRAGKQRLYAEEMA